MAILNFIAISPSEGDDPLNPLFAPLADVYRGRTVLIAKAFGGWTQGGSGPRHEYDIAC